MGGQTVRRIPGASVAPFDWTGDGPGSGRYAPPIRVPPDPKVRAYIAGIVEIGACIRTRRVNGRRYLALFVTTQERRIALWLKLTLGTGQIDQMGPSARHRRPSYQYRILSEPSVVALLEALEPYFVARRSQVARRLAPYRRRRGGSGKHSHRP